MAKNAGAAKPAATSEAAKSASDVEKPVEAEVSSGADQQTGASGSVAAPAGALDLNALAKTREALEQQLKFWSLAVEDTNRSWRHFDDQVAGASKELLRLRDVEGQFKSLAAVHDDEVKRAAALATELADVKIREVAANERAAKLEDLCEQIKERAVDIHAALQTSRANEQKLQDDLKTLESDIVLVRRHVQEEEAAKLAAEEKTQKLQSAIKDMEAVEAEARERLARVIEENRLLSQQVPQLTADNSSYQKQLSASERENARMQAERRVSSDRINDLETEIKTLRDDLASLVAAKPGAQAPAKPEPVVAEPAIEIDELDLVSSLDQAFAIADDLDAPAADPKQS